MRQKDESVVEYMRRVTHNLGFEYESILDDLPTIEALVEYFELWSKYDTEFLSGIQAAIEEGADPMAYNEFLTKYQLQWGQWTSGAWV